MEVVESFVSIQGEGPFQGRLVRFIRFFGCNLKCPWCDSKYAREGEKMVVNMTVDQLANLCGSGPDMVVLTGGEPTLQKDLPSLIGWLAHMGKSIQIETNGTVFVPLHDSVTVVVSPKPFQTHDGSVFRQWSKRRNTFFKFVISNTPPFTLFDVEEFFNKNLINPFNPVYLMAEGVNRELAIRDTIPIIDELRKFTRDIDYRVQLREHIMLYQNKRGV